MSFRKLDGYLQDAQGKEQSELNDKNPFKLAAFDGGKKRLGWTKAIDLAQVKKALGEAALLLAGKEYFIFSGIGGSGNGIKVLLS